MIEDRTIHGPDGGYFGGTDSAGICGVSEFQTAYEMYYVFLGVTQKIPYFDRSLRARLHWGRVLEPLIVSEYERVTGNKVDFPEGLIRMPDDLRFIACHPDGVVHPKPVHPLVEAKSANQWRAAWGTGIADIPESTVYPLDGEESTIWTPQLTDPSEIPTDVFFQGQHNMLVMNKEVCDFPLMRLTPEFQIARVERDSELIEAMIQCYKRFREALENKEPPPIDYEHPSTDAFMRRLYRNTTGLSIPMPKELDAWHEKYQDVYQRLKKARKEVKLLETERETITPRLRNALGNHAVLLLPDGTGYVQSEDVRGTKRFRYTKNPKT